MLIEESDPGDYRDEVPPDVLGAPTANISRAREPSSMSISPSAERTCSPESLATSKNLIPPQISAIPPAMMKIAPIVLACSTGFVYMTDD